MLNHNFSPLITILDLRNKNYTEIGSVEIGSQRGLLVKSPTELLLLMEPAKMPIVIRLARHFGQFKLDSQNLGTGRLELRFRTGLGSYHIVVHDHRDGVDYIECRTSFIPSFGFLGLEIYPDVLFIDGATGSVPRQKAVLQQQVQLRSASVLLELEGRTGTAFYHHDLSALSDLAEDTRSSLSGIIKIRWPELGPSFRQENQEPLRRGRKYSIGHFHLIIDHQKCYSARDLSMQMIRSLERVYPRLKLPKLSLENYFRIAKDSLRDLARNHGCWQSVGNSDYLNAYMNDYGNPPESMVQMAVLSTVWEYDQKFPSRYGEMVCSKILEGIKNFFNPKTQCIERWIPIKEYVLDNDEEQKRPRVMDSWYLHHPLIQIADMMQSGFREDDLEGKFYSSLGYCIRVARHFGYRWPVFYDLDSLDVIKGETQPGEGGEKDVAGLFAFLMLRAYELSKDERYLREAIRAADSLSEYGFDLIYQSNNTAYAAEALLELWGLYPDSNYFQLAELCIGNLIRNSAIWTRGYGNSSNIPTFFSLFPLSDAPYSAVFEEQECLASFKRFLVKAKEIGAPVSPGMEMLVCEFIKHAIARLPYYYPPLLPEDILSPEPKTGVVYKDSWIPLEDIGDGWIPVGQVGQEVYGAGGIFRVLNSFSIELASSASHLLVNYPFSVVRRSRGMVRIQVHGSKGYDFQFRLNGLGTNTYTIEFQHGEGITLKGRSPVLHRRAGQVITVRWV